MDTQAITPASERRTRITEAQLIKMIIMLENAPDIARAVARGPQLPFWRRVARELNDMGPTTKDPSSWKKVWHDYKHSVKRRLIQYNDDISAGNYPKQFTLLQKRTLKLLDISYKRIKVSEDIGGSGSDGEDANGTDADCSKDAFDMGDAMDSQSSMGATGGQDELEDDTKEEPASSSFSNSINACQQRLEKMPNITITKQKNADEDDDPLSSYLPKNANKFGRPMKRKREEAFEQALETNRNLIAVMKTTLSVQKDLVTELRGMKKAMEDLNDNIRGLAESLKQK